MQYLPGSLQGIDASQLFPIGVQPSFKESRQGLLQVPIEQDQPEVYAASSWQEDLIDERLRGS